jgi:glycosyltransferase involved in cell wall biosynthesis
VSVVVPARNDAADLPKAIDAVLAEAYPGELEVVVAVGPSGDRTEQVALDLAARHPVVRVVANPEGRTPSALNRAIDASSHGIVARVDARSVIRHGYLERAVRRLGETGAGNVGGVQDAVGQTTFERAVAAAMRSPLGTGGARYRGSGSAGPVDTVYLGVFRRDALDAVGRFDESLERNQDYELNWRLRAAGWSVWFDPALTVAYRPRGSLRAVARQYADYGRWKCEVLRRHPRSVRMRQLLPPIVVAVLATSTAAALVWPGALTIPVAYAALIGPGGVALTRREPMAVRLRVPAVLAAMHLAWGGAFLVELVTASLRRR